MNHKKILSIIVIPSIIFFSMLAVEKNENTDLTSLYPAKGELENWQPDGEFELAIGEDLFLLINGGAEIYYEYGFKQTVFQSYIYSEGHRINLEIYEMDSPESAYGMYTFKTGINGTPLEVGHAGWLESYFLNFWKGKFLVTIIGLDTDTNTLEGIKKIGRAVDSKIDTDFRLPQITSYLPEENLQVNGTTYLKGNLALYNQDLFGPKDIFGLKEGVIGKYENYSILIFQYENQSESKKWYENAKQHLNRNNQFTDFMDYDDKFKIRNTNQNEFIIKQYQNWIVIIMGNRNTDFNKVLNSAKSRLKQ